MTAKTQGQVQDDNKMGDFEKYLISKNIIPSKVNEAVDLIQQFEQHSGISANNAKTGEIFSFIEKLVNEKNDTEDVLSYLYYFGKYSGNNDLALVSLQFWDGCEVMENFYKRLGERFDNKIRDRVFDGIERPSAGIPPLQKARTMQVVIERVESLVDTGDLRQLLSECLRDLSDAPHLKDRKLYEEINDFDSFLKFKRQEYVQYLQGFKERGEFYFSQEITDEVIEFVRQNPEIAYGERIGNILYITKIPYMTKEYLAEKDEDKRRYYYCHCPWARETLKQGEKTVSATFCNCSAGFIKKPWEVILGQKLDVDILESILQGDLRCRFAIHLPERINYPIGT